MRLVRLWTAAIVLVLGLAEGLAHDVLQTFVVHAVAFQFRTNALEIRLELTFFEQTSQLERQRMDANQDGRLTRAEVGRYAREAEVALMRGLRLTIGNQAVDLVPLYEPELQLDHFDTTSPGHHRLVFQLFTPFPGAFPPGSEVRLEDSLWPGEPALLSLQTGPTVGADVFRGAATLGAPGKPHAFTTRVPLTVRRGIDRPGGRSGFGETGLTRRAVEPGIHEENP